MEKYMNANAVFSKFSRDYMALKKDLPIRPSEMAVINIITKRDGNFTPLSIAELLGVSKPMIAAHVASLEKKGYIYKEGSELDKRSFYVRPTDKAKVLADAFEARQTKYLKRIEAHLGETEFAAMVRLLDKTQTILDEIKEV